MPTNAARPAAAERLRAESPEWGRRDDAHRIERSYRFWSFRVAFAPVAGGAALAEAEGHHPDISFGRGYVTVSLRTKKIKDSPQHDFVMAARLDRLAGGGAGD